MPWRYRTRVLFQDLPPVEGAGSENYPSGELDRIDRRDGTIERRIRCGDTFLPMWGAIATDDLPDWTATYFSSICRNRQVD